MPVRRLSADTARSIRLSFGKYGSRALDFIESAAELLDGTGPVAKQPEIVAYCLREAFMSILNTQPQQSPAAQWRHLAESASEAIRGVERARGLGKDAEDAAAESLAEAASKIENFEEDQETHRKRLVAVLAQRTGSEPGHWADGSVRAYVRIIGRSNDGVHGDASAGDVRLLWVEAIRVLEALFTPVDVRNPRLDQLAALVSPTDRDLAELINLIIAPNHFRRFLSRLMTVSWLPLLEGAALLDLPLDDSGWAGYEVVDRLGGVDPAEVARFQRRVWERSDRSFRSANTIAWSVQHSGLIEARELAIELARQFPQTVELATLRVEQLDPTDDFIVDLARVAIVPEVLKSNTYLEPLTDAYLSGINETTWRSRVGTLVQLLTTHNGDEHWGYFRDRPGGLGEPVETWDSAAEQMVFLLGEAIARSVLIAPAEEMNEVIDQLPVDTRHRARVFYLVRQPELDLGLARSEIAGAITSRFPTPDDGELVDRILRSNDPLFVADTRPAFGQAPTVKEVAAALHDNNIPNVWRQKFAWSAFLPDESWREWRTALDVIAGRFGRPSREALARPRVEFSEVESPIAADELSAMPLDVAIETIRAWRPEGRGRGSAMELANAATVAFSTSPTMWFADPVRVVSGLRHPTYISSYVRALTDWLSSDAILPASLIELIELVWAEPWPPNDLGGEDGWDQEATWVPAQHATLDLIRKLADLNLEWTDFEAAWSVVAAASFPDSPEEVGVGSSDSLTRAINRAGPRAFRVGLSLLAQEFRSTRTIKVAHLNLLDNAVAVRGPLATEYRALIAIESRLIRSIASEWLDANFDDLFVRSEHAQDAVDISMKFGPADSDVLRRSRRLVRDAVARGVDRSLDRMLIGMLWQLSDYRVGQVEKFLAGEQKLSEAGAVLGRLLSNAESLTKAQIRIVLDFWTMAADHRPRQSLAGFAWMSRSAAIPDEDWIRLTRASVPSWTDSVNGLHLVAERLENLPLSDDVLDLMSDLVQLRGATWDRGRVVSVAVQTLFDHPELASSLSYQRLDHVLRERGLL